MVFYKDLKDQQLLLPLNIRELIPDNHICFLIDKIIQNFDLTEFEKNYEGAGHPAYHPKLILKILILGMTDSIRSSRKIAKNARENVSYMYLAGLLQPDFRTISEFRKNNSDLIHLSFREVVKYALNLEMINLGHICIDGTKMRANASHSSAIKKDDFPELKELIKKEIEEGIKIDEAEDEMFGDKNIDELPSGINRKTITERIKEKYQSGNEAKKDRIKNQIQKIEKEMEKTDSAISFTDPECRFMKNKNKINEYSYNPQITVDSLNGIIIASDVTSETRDVNQLQPQIDQVEKNVGDLPESMKVIADYGYYSSKNLKFLKSKELDGYIPDLKKASKFKGNKVKDENPFSKEHFRYDPEDDSFICPNNQRLNFRFEYFDTNKNMNVRNYRTIHCKQCFELNKCTKNSRGRTIKDYEGMEVERISMKEKMSSEHSALIYHTRKKVVERIFGHIKKNLGVREFLLRGLNGVKIEFNLACIATNLKRIWNYLHNFDRKTSLAMC